MKKVAGVTGSYHIDESDERDQKNLCGEVLAVREDAGGSACSAADRPVSPLLY